MKLLFLIGLMIQLLLVASVLNASGMPQLAKSVLVVVDGLMSLYLFLKG